MSIIGSICSFSERLDILPDVLATIRHQVDRLYVNVNPVGGVDHKDNAKFLPLRDCDWSPGDIFVTFDDDILYAPNFVADLLAGMERTGAPAVGYHGVRWKRMPIPSYYKCSGGEPWCDAPAFFHDLAADMEVDILATCGTATDLGRVQLSFSDFGTPGMADIWYSRRLARAGARRCVLRHRGNWCSIPPKMAGRQTICTYYTGGGGNDAEQTRMVNATPWGKHVRRG